MAAYMKTLFFLVFLSFLVISVYDVFSNFEENGCDMTWMYEYPEYVKTKLNKAVKQKYPKYGLYLYGEGGYAQNIKSFKLTGIPVLFIPGNAGSYRQVRSLGSVALRKAERFRDKIHFNYFSVDLNEELSGLFGGVLQEQTEFVHECIKHILTLYKTAKHSPTSVVLVGHSMGGVIARGLFTLPDFDHQLVHTIFTQATPHQSPVTPLDCIITDYYKKVNNYWIENGNSSLSHVTVFSSGGGYRDILVRTGLTSLSGVVDEKMSVSSLTMSVPRVWASTDHLCIVWCNEFVLVTKRAMFDMIDVKTKQISSDPNLRLNVVQHHFHHNPGYSFSSPQPSNVRLEEEIKWDIKDQMQWTFTREKVKKTRYLAVPLNAGLSFVATTTIPGDSWIMGCIDSESKQQCSSGINLSSLTKLVPPEKLHRRMIVLSPEILLDFTHLIIIVPKTQSKLTVSGEQFDMVERTLTYQTPGFWGTVFGRPISLVTGQGEVISATDPGAMFYNVSLVGLENIWQSVVASLKSFDCQEVSDGASHDGDGGSLMTMNVPWNSEDVSSYVPSNVSVSTLSLKLMVGKPLNYSSDPSLFLHLNPSCSYRLNFIPSLQESLGQIARFCAGLIPVFVVVNIMMALGQQLYQPTAIKSFSESHASYADNWRLVPWIGLVSCILMREEVHWLVVAAGIPDDDSVSLNNKRIGFALMNILLYLVSFAFIRVHATSLDLIFSAIGIVLRLNCDCGTSKVLDIINRIFQSAVMIGSLYLAIFHCGAAALVVVVFLASLKAIGAFKRQSTSRHIHLTMVLLLLWLLILNGPSFIVWVQNLRFSRSLTPDPSKLPASICCVAMFISCLLPQGFTSYGCLWARRLIHISCFLALVYAMESVYRLPYVICIGVIVYVLAQLYASLVGGPRDGDNEPDEDSSSDTEELDEKKSK